MHANAAEVKRAQKIVDSHVNPVRPDFLVREAVPDIMETKTRGNTMKTPSFMTISDMKVMNGTNPAVSFSTSSNAKPMAAAAK